MVRIKIGSQQLHMACRVHFEAVCAYIKRRSFDYRRELFAQVCSAMPYDKSFEECEAAGDWNWLERFLLADTDQLRNLAKQKDKLQFEQFKNLYMGHFCAGDSRYVDADTKYNAYTFLENLNIQICPYCDEEYLDVLTKANGKKIRTLELDHFYPKGQYPALAMCFFNLIPSGQNCNGIKLENMLGMSPYEASIEACTTLHPDLPVGVNMETVSVDDCTIKFHAEKDMQKNVEVLCLEQRYEKHKSKAHKYLYNKQFYDEAKVSEMIRMGFFASKEHADRVLYDMEPQGDRPDLLGKLKKDILNM